MQPQKRTRSSGPVNLIVSSFSEITQQEKIPPPTHRPKENKEKKQPKQNVDPERPKKAHKQPKQHKQPREKPKKEEETHLVKQQKEKKVECQKQIVRSGIALMTKEKEEEMGKMLSRLNKISELKKSQQQRLQREKMSTISAAQCEAEKKKNGENEVLVDLHYPKGSEVRVYVDPKNFAFSVTFNQTDVSKNINKFYIMQILQSLAHPDQYYVFTRWGRVGLVGNKAEAGPIPLEEALDNYRAKIQEKLEHGYKKIQTTYENQRRNFYFPRREKKGEVESKLQVKVQSLIRLIFDMKMMNSQLKEIGYDSKKMPLGKIAQASILKGYQALKEVMEELKGKRRKECISDWSSRFFSHIPHDFGMKNISNYVLDNEVKVRAKLELLQSLQDIQLFTKMIDQTPEDPDLNELDSNYLKLSYTIVPLDKDAPHYSTIIRYVENTHAPSHNQYKIEVDTIYQLTNKAEDGFKQFIGNSQLLWHGSRLTNFVGILSNGLRIAPPEAPATGYMFGKGVYFADVVSKSANYCYATKVNPLGCLLLCQVALGNQNEKFYADYYANLLPAEMHSVKGVGRMAPKDSEKIDDVLVPNGPLVETGISNTSLHYNEYVVYDVSQIRCRFLLKVKFIFK